jgi:hypothetical protein
MRSNKLLVNVSGGELSPELYSRLDLPIYERGNQRIQNYIVLPQGGLQFRNGFQHVHNTYGLKDGRLISFSFSEADTYVIELTDKKMRFYRNFGVILNTTSKTITAITKASTAVVTSAAHGFTNGQEIYLTGIVGMKELNNQFFLVAGVTTDTFQLEDIFGDPINSTAFNTYTSGGSATKPFEIDTPYEEAYLKELHYKQSADEIRITHQKYPPFKMTRTGHTTWTITTFARTEDPFKQSAITAITKANPGVFTTSAAHNLTVDDEVFISDVGGMVQLNYQRYKVNTVPLSTTFTVKAVDTGTPLNTTSFTTYTSGGIVIMTKYCPKTLAFLDSTRLGYGNWEASPAGLAFSRAPDSSTGATRFDDFTVGANATDSVRTALAPIFDKIDSIQWIANVNRQVVVGALSSIRRLTGDNENDPISPSSINSRPINNIGAAPIQPYSSGQSLFYFDLTGKRVHSFLFTYQASDYVTVNQNLASNHLSSSLFKAMAQQRGDSGLLWVQREDGVLLGLTFNELESIFGWHRHYLGGKSMVAGVEYDRAKVLSITIEPRVNQESVLWAIVERKVGSKTYRSVEYLTQPIRFVEIEDFRSENGFAAQAADTDKYINATFEQLKNSIHLDSAITYDGSALSTTITMTPSLVTLGETITITASAAFFDTTMIGKQIWKKYDLRGVGGGRAEITGILSSTQALATVVSAFNNTDAIPAGSWYLTTDKVYGLFHRVGETVAIQVDGAPGGTAVVGSDGSVDLGSQASVAHIGYSYLGLAMTLNLDIAGNRGSNEARIRKILNILPRFHNTVGAKVGTTLWNTQEVTFKTVNDLTDRPTPLFKGIAGLRPSDSYTEQTKQVVIMQDIPAPQTVLSLDIELEIAAD